MVRYATALTGCIQHFLLQAHAQDWKTVYLDLSVRVPRYYRERICLLVELQYVGVPFMAGFASPRLRDCKYDHFDFDCKRSRSSVAFFFPLPHL